jgi:MFS family permease
MSTATPHNGHGWSDRSWRDLTVRFAVGLAFADASIVVLALPQIVGELDTTISDVTWVIMSYNLALIAGVLAFLGGARHLSSRRALVGGLALFGLASLGCGAAQDLELLVAMRCVQGLGGALLLCASLPLLAGVARPGDSPTAEWAAAAAIGAAIGPAAGGLLTQVFDWRAIFLTQAPAAALAVVAVLAAPDHSFRAVTDEGEQRKDLGPGLANVALLLLSAGLIGALFLEVVLLIDVWRLEPITAAGVVSAIPVATIVLERVARGRSPIFFGVVGAALLAVGLVGIAFVSHQQVGWMVVALTLCGAGLGLAFTTLSDSAMSGAGSAITRAGRTSAAREAGLVIGLLIITPVFVHDLDQARDRAVPPIAQALIASPIPTPQKIQLGVGLLKISRNLPPGELPDLGPAFDPVRAQATGSTAAQITALESQVNEQIERTVTRSFRRSLLYCAAFALLVLPVLSLRLVHLRRRRVMALR